MINNGIYSIHLNSIFWYNNDNACYLPIFRSIKPANEELYSRFRDKWKHFIKKYTLTEYRASIIKMILFLTFILRPVMF